MGLQVDGIAVACRDGDDLLSATVRSGQWPVGVLCTTGDCANCLAAVDGVAYVRMCQTSAASALAVTTMAANELPPLPEPREAPTPAAIEHRRADVVVVGGGRSGQAASAAAEADGDTVFVLDAGAGEEVIAVYAGPLVVARTPDAMLHVSCDRVIVATGSSTIPPIVEGSRLAGLITPRAHDRFVERGIDLGVVVRPGSPNVRFESADNHRVSAVTSTDATMACDTVVVDAGRSPRDALIRMATDLNVEVVGSAAEQGDHPPAPTTGLVCPCKGVSAEQLHEVWDRGFEHMELLKRGSGAGTGTCQGASCMPYLRSFVAEKVGETVAPFTARPLTRQLTMAEVAAGQYLPAVARTALDAEHRALGAAMDRIGGWWRPWSYGDTDAEYEAVRHRVSVGDVSTLGKMIVQGPDAEALLQKLYPTDISTIRAGRSRYVLMLDERGYVFDDGMVARVGDNQFMLTFTTGGASMAEMWVRDQADGLDVRILNQTLSLGAINVTGPRSRELLTALGLGEDIPFLGFDQREIAGVECTVFRLSFTGELSYELHHRRVDSVALWRALLAAGDSLGIRPHGLETLMRLRLEKGHIVVGQDTDYDSSPRRLDHDWAVNLDCGDFVGRHATQRTRELPLDKKLVGLTAATTPHEGASLWSGDRFAGHVTSSTWSPSAETAVMLAWLRLDDGASPEHLEVETFAGRIPAHRAELPFYDPGGRRPRA
ncbi:MAG: glycine cleavage system aminomethyltransferase T/bacterioferritin-associated ferredoxin [Candidatus Aldehydirespiratoraceae bacterium]|jgi:glycine cleavage system aminomethyltransferase T/bacterioferritin-associated ferredoxin